MNEIQIDKGERPGSDTEPTSPNTTIGSPEVASSAIVRPELDVDDGIKWQSPRHKQIAKWMNSASPEQLEKFMNDLIELDESRPPSCPNLVRNIL